MATDSWIGRKGNWDTPSDWSDGLPNRSSRVITEGNPKVTKSFGIVKSIENLQTLTFVDAGASSVTRDLTNSGVLQIDRKTGNGGTSLKIGGTLANSGTVQIGPTDNTLSADSTIRAGSLANAGTYATIGLYGSSAAKAIFDVDSAAGFGDAGALSGSVSLSSDALIEFANGQISTIAFASGLALTGAHAFVADAYHTGSNSALTGLKTIDGGLELDDGASVKTTGAMSVVGAITLHSSSLTVGGPLVIGGQMEIDVPGSGGSSLMVDGTLTNDGFIEIGPVSGALAASSKLKAADVVNDGLLDVLGDQAAHVHVALRSEGPLTNDGSINFSNDNDKLASAISGSGDMSSADRSRLELAAGVSSGETVTFAGGDQLILDQASSYDGTIDDFFKGDGVVARGFAEAATLLSYTQTGPDSCSWTLTAGAKTAVLNFAGEPYAKSDFSIVSAQSGAGLAIKFV